MSMSTPNASPAADTTSDEGPSHIVRAVLSELNEGRIAELVARFDDRFTFEDHALGLELSDRSRLSDYFVRARELFPEFTVEVLSLLESADRVVVEWKLTATENVVYWRQLRLPIVVYGMSSVQVENRKITRWSDYYDGGRARRAGLTSVFVDWAES